MPSADATKQHLQLRGSKYSAPGPKPRGRTARRLEAPASSQDHLARGDDRGRRLERDRHGLPAAIGQEDARGRNAPEDADDRALVEQVEEVRVDGDTVLLAADLEDLLQTQVE